MKRLILISVLMFIYYIVNGFPQSTSKKRAVYHEPFRIGENMKMDVKEYAAGKLTGMQYSGNQESGSGMEITLPHASDIAHYDISVAINPNDPENVIASTLLLEWDGTNMGYALGANFFKSNDGGQSWSGGDEVVDYPNRGYQTISFNKNDRVFLSHTDADKGISMSYTTNNGLTWNTKVVSEAPGGIFGYNIEGNMCVDNFSAGLNSGNVYCVWHRQGSLINNEQIIFSRSTNSGLTWSPEIGISSEIGYSADNNFPDITTGPNGQVYVCWLLEEVYTCDETAIGFNASLTGGLVWQTSRKIHDQIRAPHSTQPKTFRIRSSPSIACDVSDGPFGGNIYVVWCNVGYPGENEGENPDVYFMKSEDEGQTWSDPVLVNTDPVPGGSNQLLPAVTCDPVTGILSVIYYDDRACGLEELDVWVANSYDGGQSWENHKISEETIQIREFFEDNPSFLNKIDIASYDHLVVPGWLGTEGLKTVMKVAPYNTCSLTRPYINLLEVDEQNGTINLQWETIGDKGFQHFNIYRNEELVATTTDLSFTEILPSPGNYTYRITAQHAEGESGSSSRPITWGSADLMLSSPLLQMVAGAATTFSRKLLLSNYGLLNLEYSIKPAILSDNTVLNYCTPECDGGVFIRNVRFGEINNYSFWPGYENFFGLSQAARPGETDTLLVQIRNWLYGFDEVWAKAWIDWNKDGEFDETEYYELELIDEWRQYFQAVIQYPEDMPVGSLRMRVFGGNDDLGSCDSAYWDEHEDYQIYNLSWISDSGFTGEVLSDSSSCINLDFNTTNLQYGNYIVNLEVTDRLTGELKQTLQTYLTIDSVEILPPANLTAQIVGEDVLLSWQPPATEVPLAYVVYRYGTESVEVFQTEQIIFEDENPGNGIWEYEVMALYEAGESIPAGPVVAEISGMISTSIQVSEGWSGISSYVQPADSTFASLFAGMDELVVIYNDDGLFIPGNTNNTLDFWNSNSGYICKMNEAVTFGLNGYPVLSAAIQLNEGWNILPVLSSEPLSPENLFGENYSQVEIMKEIAGSRIVWPSKNINQIGLLEPGKAYFVKVYSPIILSD